ncbi:WHG domain-containing protein [Kitasatospora sp. McL0602]|uniref:WHG domain-containing protein n=1 Tax=Kitasatospora sp. McL0602 TaxID=3439530 RepID=UPI003F8B1B6D
MGAPDEAVAAWVAEYISADTGSSTGTGTGTAGDPERAGGALAGAVMAWSRLHGVVSLEAEGHYNGMHTLADTFGLG